MDVRELTSKYTKFTIITYVNHRPTMRWFKSESPVAWVEARDRLIKAGILSLQLAGRISESGGWMLSVDKNDFSEDKAEELPPSLVG